jgi:hypothetical protein
MQSIGLRVLTSLAYLVLHEGRRDIQIANSKVKRKQESPATAMQAPRGRGGVTPIHS